jgi:hypothetical protein
MRLAALAAIGLALLVEGGAVAGAPADVAGMVDLLPAGVVDAIYLAIARELHLAAAAIAALMLVTSLALAALCGACRSSRPLGGPAARR